MKNTYKLLIVLLLATTCFTSCEDMDDNISTIPGLEVEDFIYKGLNVYYLWKEDVPDLANDRFASQEEKIAFLSSKDSPEMLFQDLLFKPVSKFPEEQAVDRFSVLVSDYVALEKLFQGTTKNNGVDYGLRRKTSDRTKVYGWVRYIIPNSDASTKDIQRGDIFYAVDGVALNDQNYLDLLGKDTYTLNLADFAGGNITPNGRSVTLTKTELTENPVLLTKVINSGDHKIGYLVYNGFTSTFNSQLNAAFGELKAAGITELVLDLRYNSGGSIKTAAGLASMITGQFNGQLFAKEQWNPEVQAVYEEKNPGALVENFTNTLDDKAINSLNFSKVYILTTNSTASASELVINGLNPYINVVQIGDKTTGKNVGSITLYDSPTLVTKNNISKKHNYAMQPLVIKTINKDGFSEYENGLIPDIPLTEKLDDLSELGNPEELLLSAAIAQITSSGRSIPQQSVTPERDFKDSKSIRRFGTEMYIESLR